MKDHHLDYNFGPDYAVDHAPGVWNWIYRGDKILVSRWEHDALDHDPDPRPTHLHSDLEQISIVLEGTVEHTVGDLVSVQPAGTVYHVPAGTPHRIQRINRDPVVILDIFSDVKGNFAIDFPARAMNRADFE